MSIARRLMIVWCNPDTGNEFSDKYVEYFGDLFSILRDNVEFAKYMTFICVGHFNESKARGLNVNDVLINIYDVTKIIKCAPNTVTFHHLLLNVTTSKEMKVFHFRSMNSSACISLPNIYM